MFDFLIAVILVLVIIYVVHMIIEALNLPANIKQIAYIVVGLIVLFWLLQFLGIWSGDLGGRPLLRP